MSSGLKVIQRIAAQQSAAAPPEPAKQGDRPVLTLESVLDRLWRFMKNTFTSKSLDDQLKEDKLVMGAAFEDLFIDQCRRDQCWYTSADIAGGTVIDPDTGDIIEIATGDVQWQEQLRTSDVEVGTKNEKALSPAALALMPAYPRFELNAAAADPANLDELVKDLGPERIQRWFAVKTYRKALTADQARTLYFENAKGRKTVESMMAAGSVKLVGFAKVMHDPRTRVA